jgi:hypothetical protein
MRSRTWLTYKNVSMVAGDVRMIDAVLRDDQHRLIRHALPVPVIRVARQRIVRDGEGEMNRLLEVEGTVKLGVEGAMVAPEQSTVK